MQDQVYAVPACEHEEPGGAQFVIRGVQQLFLFRSLLPRPLDRTRPKGPCPFLGSQLIGFWAAGDMGERCV